MVHQLDRAAIQLLDNEFYKQVYIFGRTIENLKSYEEDLAFDWLNKLIIVTDNVEEVRLRNDFMHYLVKSCINGQLDPPFDEKPPSKGSFLSMSKLLQQHMDKTCWSPVELIEPSEHKNFNYALLILNTRIALPKTVTCSLWQNAKHRVLVDGGTNRWLSFLHDLPDEGRELKNPDVVNGDFDSVNENTLEFFREKGATIEHTPDQDETDFTKAVRLLEPILEKKQITSIIAIQEHGDRFDHIMANINTLYKANKFLKDTRLYLISEGSLTWLLAPGKHSIHVPMHLVDNQRWCSLVPISGKTIVTTKGLKWDLENGELEFGKLVSTSNTYASQNLEVTTNNYLLWSMGVFYFD